MMKKDKILEDDDDERYQLKNKKIKTLRTCNSILA